MNRASLFSERLVTVIGGSGLVGRSIVQRMARRGWRVRVAVRRPNEALFVQPYGVVGQVIPVQCNIRDEASMRRVIAGSDAVVNCVGLLWETGKNRFDAVHVEGAARAARLAVEAGASFTHISAIGADPESPARYGRTKAAGEQAVLGACPDAVILRPSLAFGAEGDFFCQFAAMAPFTPMMPLVGAETRFQPAWIEDIAEAACLGATGKAAPGLYELGGPRVASLRELIELMLRIIRRRRLIVNFPFGPARLGGRILQLSAIIGVQPPLTADQVDMLRRDNIVAEGARGFAALGIRPMAMEAVLGGYLYSYRRFGQYSRLTGPDTTVERLHDSPAS